ncbi:MAG: hypothetical protein K2I06_06495 [Ruminococcus sp.]|nr:hypothetical protein [Ruminococcus sp.]
MNKDFYYNDVNDKNGLPNSFKTGLATASFVISLLNLVFCACMGSFITAPVSVILGVVSLATHRGGKIFAILGIVISVISSVLFALYMYVAVKVAPDVMYFQQNSTEIISAYESDGEIPEQFEKYRSSDYDKYWNAMGCNDFDGFFKIWIESYKRKYGYTAPSSVPDNPETTAPETPKNDRNREELVDLNYTGAISGIKFLKTA